MHGINLFLRLERSLRPSLSWPWPITLTTPRDPPISRWISLAVVAEEEARLKAGTMMMQTPCCSRKPPQPRQRRSARNQPVSRPRPTWPLVDAAATRISPLTVPSVQLVAASVSRPTLPAPAADMFQCSAPTRAGPPGQTILNLVFQPRRGPCRPEPVVHRCRTHSCTSCPPPPRLSILPPHFPGPAQTPVLSTVSPSQRRSWDWVTKQHQRPLDWGLWLRKPVSARQALRATP